MHSHYQTYIMSILVAEQIFTGQAGFLLGVCVSLGAQMANGSL